MQMITLILSGLALLAATLCLILILQEKKRSKERNAALKQYIDRKITAGFKSAGKEVQDYVRKQNSVLDEQRNAKVFEIMGEYDKEINARHDDLQKRVEDLEHGIVPDFEEARKAADAVNDFNRGLSGILGFDPMEAAKKARRARNGGD